MCKDREAMATTSLVAVAEIENGLDGSGTMMGKESRFVAR